jgi:hypothetical protein
MKQNLFKSVQRFLRGTSCPTALQIAAYADCQLIGPERHRVERHIADCDTCGEMIAFLVKSEPRPIGALPESLLREANAFGHPARNRLLPNWKIASAGAFALLFAIALISRLIDREQIHRSPIQTPSPSTQIAANTERGPLAAPRSNPQTRGGAESQSPFLSPLPGEEVDASNLVFRWIADNLAGTYEVQVLTDEGSVAWEGKARTSSLALPKTVKLSKGGTYFVRLKIHTRNGAIVQTKPVKFIAG